MQANRKLLMAASNDDVADADVPDKSKLAKLNCGAAKNHRVNNPWKDLIEISVN